MPDRLRARRSTRLQKCYHTQSPEMYDNLLREFEASPKFKRLIHEWELEERARHWRNIWLKVPRNNRYIIERPDHIEGLSNDIRHKRKTNVLCIPVAEYEQHLRKYDHARAVEKQERVEKRRILREKIIKEFEKMKRKRQTVGRSRLYIGGT